MLSPTANFKHAELVDVQALALQHPNQISSPSIHELENIVAGNCVKVATGERGSGNGGEAFWVEVANVGPLHMLGIIVNNLTFTYIHHLSAGDYILVDKSQVFAITE